VRFDRFLTDETNGTMTDFVAVALNFSGVRREVELTVPWSGRWHDVISEKFHTINQTIELTLPPWQAAVLLYTR
jgi:hypothetical protein